MTSARQRVALLLAPDLRTVAALIDEARAALDELDYDRPPGRYAIDPVVVEARRKLAEARALLRGD
jgi:hypothetical protein